MSNELTIPEFLKRGKKAQDAVDEILKPLSNVPSTPQEPKKAPKSTRPSERPQPPKSKVVRLKTKTESKPVETAGSKAFGKAMAEMKKDQPKGKTEIIVRMLSRKNGASRVEVLEALKWPAINLKGLSKQYAKRFGYKASQNKDSGEMRYFLVRK